VTYLIVGLDRATFTPWHRHVLARDIATAKRAAKVRAAAEGIRLEVAAVIGPGAYVLSDRAPRPAAAQTAA
jgi:hypothetical protein